MFTLGPHELIVGLGSNSPDALGMLRRARSRLRNHARLRVVATSPIYESDALLPPNAPEDWNRPYLNAACLVQVTDAQWLSRSSPEDAAQGIVETLKELERSLGRTDAPRWAPRPIDLDLLAWGRPSVRTGPATVPHPGLSERPFALLPALDCAGPRGRVPAHPWQYARPEDVPQRTRLAPAAWPELVGVLNLTPDSFSDGGAHAGPGKVERAARRLVSEGATVIDVGAESTRPGATPLSAQEELERLSEPLAAIASLSRELRFGISLDTRHPETLGWCLERFPLAWINDVEGFSSPRMLELAARSGCDAVLMHSLGVPPRAEVVLEPGRDPVAEVLAWAKDGVERLARAGIGRERIILDPGLGFGKTPAQNLALALRARELAALRTRVLVGHSRKRFLDPAQALPAAERDLETALVTAQLADCGVDYLRVHSPGLQARALSLGARIAWARELGRGRSAPG